LYEKFLASWTLLTHDMVVAQRSARALVEREATLRIVELVAHYETHCTHLAASMKREHAKVKADGASNAAMRGTEADHRAAIAAHEGLLFKQIRRDFAAAVAELAEAQTVYELEMTELKRLKTARALREAAEEQEQEKTLAQ
jgi:hypothetical protein